MDEETQAARIVHVLNKSDLLDGDDEKVSILKNVFPKGIFVSAIMGDGVVDLLTHLDWHLGKSAVLVTVEVTPIDGAARAWLHQNAMVKSSHHDKRGNEKILLRIDPADCARLRSRWPNLSVIRT